VIIIFFRFLVDDIALRWVLNKFAQCLLFFLSFFSFFGRWYTLVCLEFFMNLRF
jgi:hypothetical protein